MERSSKMCDRLWTIIPGILVLVSLGLTPAEAYEEIPVEKGGSISGSIFFDGVVPARKPLKVKAPCENNTAMSEELIVNKSKDGTKSVIVNTVVSIVEIAKGKPFAKETPVLDQKACVFIPHIVVVRAETKLSVLNSDEMVHNIHTDTDINKESNSSMQPHETTHLKYDEPDHVAVHCDLHPWMKAWIVVAANPYFQVTGEDGSFKIEEIPAGTYSLSFWHETLGEQKKEVTVKAGDDSKIDCTLSKK